VIQLLRIHDLRIYRDVEFRPAPSVTTVVGDNGSGKSSLLEAIGLFSTLSSPRAPSLKVVVREGCEEGGVRLETTDGAQLGLFVRNARTVLRIGSSPAQAKDFLGRFRSVLFTPEDLDLVRGEPSLRRRALDDLLVQMRPRYRASRQDFERALKQRNAALRDSLEMEASLYGEPLAVAAAQILEARRDVVERIRPVGAEVYAELAERGSLDLTYRDTSQSGGLSGDDLVSHLTDLYRRTLGVDLERGRTTIGPHRDDLDIAIDAREARYYASRGEQRSAALAFRLAELRLLPDAVLLLDDVLSELDPHRRRRVFDVTQGGQTIVTATDAEIVPAAAKVEAVWNVADGILEEGRA
jgi:DNA replication and repair protein RecF